MKVLEPEPGNWSIIVGSEEEHSVKVVGLSNLTFQHGFSLKPPNSLEETTYRPLQGIDFSSLLEYKKNALFIKKIFKYNNEFPGSCDRQKPVSQ